MKQELQLGKYEFFPYKNETIFERLEKLSKIEKKRDKSVEELKKRTKSKR